MALTVAQLTEQIELLTKRLDAVILILENHGHLIESEIAAHESLSEAHQITASYVRRMGECPGIKLF